MTEEEKKEFEEFLQWKKEKAEKEQSENKSAVDNANEEKAVEPVKTEDSKTQEPAPETKDSDINIPLVILAVIAIFILFIALYTCSGNRSMPQAPEEVEEVVDSIEEVVEVGPDIVEPSKKEWDFTIEKDPMTDTNNIWARISSDDYIMQDFPYEGYTYASITVRYMKKYGYNVLVQITKGQINGRSYSGTNYITARFDEGSPKRFYFDEAADGSSDIVFLRGSSDFISRCKKAKDILIDIPIYQNGRQTFSFHVDEPLVWRDK